MKNTKNDVIVKNGEEFEIYHEKRSLLLGKLQKIQKKDGYISNKKMQTIADELNIHPVEVFSVVSFYSFLSTKKEGRNIIRVSNCISSVMKGNKIIIREFERRLGIKCGETTSDGKFTLEKTSCIGMCDKAPAILINEKLIGPVKKEDVSQIIGQLM